MLQSTSRFKTKALKMKIRKLYLIFSFSNSGVTSNRQCTPNSSIRASCEVS